MQTHNEADAIVVELGWVVEENKEKLLQYLNKIPI